MAIELLAPAGSPEGVRAAVMNGADAVYLGLGGFNARRGAKNFTLSEFREAAEYCRVRGVRTYVTLNTLVYDREMADAVELARAVSAAGADAVLVQDLGLARVLREALPDLPLHASTQMTIHNIAGVRRAAALGMDRVVLSRELSAEAIRKICAESPVEIEVFAHGALCFCYSGQCYFSAMIGGRSGNRGACAQPCRLEYGFGSKSGEHPLSLKDLSFAGKLRELEEMGVRCLKIEGRMKRPEYAAIVTRVFSDALREKREPTAEEMHVLEMVFSRSGFTSGYYDAAKSADMLGVRTEAVGAEAAAVARLFERTRSEYMREGERKRVPVRFACRIAAGKPAVLAVEDADGNSALVSGKVAEPARSRELTGAEVSTQLYKTGGTPYICEFARSKVDKGVSLPISEINSLRRAALAELSSRRGVPPERRSLPYERVARGRMRREEPAIVVEARRLEQLSDRLLRQKPERIYLPLEVAVGDMVRLKELAETAEVAVVLPRISTDAERASFEMMLSNAALAGVREALVGNLGAIDAALERGFALRGDFGLNITNSHALLELERLGFRSATVSFELTFARIRDMAKPIDCEFIAYGRLPLMISEQCIVKNRYGDCRCDNGVVLTDRTGENFPILRESGCRSGVYNAHKLWLADRTEDWRGLGLAAARLMFTTENPVECADVLERYRGNGNYEPGRKTRGLYYRGAQ